jgi:hypothetical protein
MCAAFVSPSLQAARERADERRLLSHSRSQPSDTDIDAAVVRLEIGGKCRDVVATSEIRMAGNAKRIGCTKSSGALISSVNRDGASCFGRFQTVWAKKGPRSSLEYGGQVRGKTYSRPRVRQCSWPLSLVSQDQIYVITCQNDARCPDAGLARMVSVSPPVRFERASGRLLSKSAGCDKPVLLKFVASNGAVASRP